MYSPKIDTLLIGPLYRLAKAKKRPMTKIVNKILSDYLEGKNETATAQEKNHSGRGQAIPQTQKNNS